MNPYAIIAALVGAIALSIAAFVGGVKYEKGIVAKRDLVAAQEQSKAIVSVMEKNDAERLANEAKARKVTKNHAAELETIRAAYAAPIGGLRITANACASLTPASGPAPSASRPDGNPPATVAIPADVERRLFDLARQADEVTAVARGLQEWVKANGFYGP